MRVRNDATGRDAEASTVSAVKVAANFGVYTANSVRLTQQASLGVLEKNSRFARTSEKALPNGLFDFLMFAGYFYALDALIARRLSPSTNREVAVWNQLGTSKSSRLSPLFERPESDTSLAGSQCVCKLLPLTDSLT